MIKYYANQRKKKNNMCLMPQTDIRDHLSCRLQPGNVVTFSVAVGLSSCMLLLHIMLIVLCSVLRTALLQEIFFWPSLKHYSQLQANKQTCNSTHRYLVRVLLADESDIFYPLFCGAEEEKRKRKVTRKVTQRGRWCCEEKQLIKQRHNTSSWKRKRQVEILIRITKTASNWTS